MADEKQDAAGVEFFEKKIRPVLVESCYRCHSTEAKKQKGKLLLDTRAAIRKGGETAPAVVPGQPQKSLLLKALRHEEDMRMPPAPANKLSAQVIADFEKWIAIGAPDPREGNTETAKDIDWTEAKHFWSFQPIRKPDLPKVNNQAWIKTPIDVFILARLEEKQLRPVNLADRRTMIRRANFDLIGLPPTPEEVEAFLKDESPDAFAQVVDRLLASPHYGERWGRHWLDVARYAEDQAHTFAVVPNTNAWRYRDWVINAFNEDMPYDRFVKLQIAADLIEKDEAARIKHLPALGFFGLGAQYYKNTDAAKAAADELDDRVDTLTRGLLGLTVSCARCHDHKFDPIPQIDYYSLAGIFSSCKLENLPLANKEAVAQEKAALDQVKKMDAAVKNFLREERAQLSLAQADQAGKYLFAAWKVQVRKRNDARAVVADIAKTDKLDQATLGRMVKVAEKPGPLLASFPKLDIPEADAKVAFDQLQKEITQQAIHRKDGPKNGKFDLVQALFLADNAVFNVPEGQVKGRLAEDKKKQLAQLSDNLAREKKIASTKALPITHGLAEATPANMKVFIRGNPAKLGEEAPRRFLKIVAGDNPAPFIKGSGRLELAEAIASKDNPLTARVMVNRVWQFHFGRGLVHTPSNFGHLGDRPTHPELLDYLTSQFIESRWSLKKLHRTIMLSTVYQLGNDRDDANLVQDADNRLLWRATRHRLDIEAWRDAMLAVSGKLDAKLGGPTMDLSAGNNARRTVYAKISRHDLNYLLRLFDFPDANITSERRNETTVPQQQLFVLNSPFVIDQAKALAARVQKEGSNDQERVQRAYQLAFGRPANAEEMKLSIGFLEGQDAKTDQGQNRLTRWERFAQILIGSNEFMYVD